MRGYSAAQPEPNSEPSVLPGLAGKLAGSVSLTATFTPTAPSSALTSVATRRSNGVAPGLPELSWLPDATGLPEPGEQGPGLDRVVGAGLADGLACAGDSARRDAGRRRRGAGERGGDPLAVEGQ